MNHALLSILVTNHFGVLTKVTGLFGRRGFNIKALSVGETEDPRVSRITVLTEGDDARLEQILRQVQKLEDVKRAVILSDAVAECGLVLMKLNPGDKRPEFASALSAHGLKSTELGGDYAIVEATGTMEYLEALIGEMRGFGLIELTRTGPTALTQTPYPLADGK